MNETSGAPESARAFSTILAVKKLVATLAGLVLLLAVVALLIFATLHVGAISSLLLRILAGAADIVLGAALLLAALYVTVRLFVRLLSSSENR